MEALERLALIQFCSPYPAIRSLAVSLLLAARYGVRVLQSCAYFASIRGFAHHFEMSVG